jgi:MFS family permease
VLTLTIQERLPYLGLAAIAWFVPALGPKVALALTFLMLIWQGLGGGVTATAWQSMIGKIIPGDRWGLFFGFQASSANLLASASAVGAGILLERNAYPLDFTLCFLATGAAMVFSWFFLAQTRETESQPVATTLEQGSLWTGLRTILSRDVNFRWFLVVRVLYQFATMAFAFYTVYAVRSYGMSEGLAGIMTGVLTAVQTAANPLLGWLGDRWSHRGIMALGALAATVSAWLAWKASTVDVFYLVFILAGIANVAYWTIGMAMTLEFGSEAERPVYIGLANTLVAPAAFLVPLFGGWLADKQATLLLSRQR